MDGGCGHPSGWSARPRPHYGASTARGQTSPTLSFTSGSLLSVPRPQEAPQDTARCKLLLALMTHSSRSPTARYVLEVSRPLSFL